MERAMHSLTPEDWSRIRYEYEHTRRPVEDICHAYGITPNTLRRRGRRWGWAMRQPPIPDQGPPAMAAALPEFRSEPTSAAEETPAHETLNLSLGALTPTLTLPLPGGGNVEVSGGGRNEAGGSHEDAGAYTSAPPAPVDPATIPDRLRGALARVLPAIEATLARLTHGPQHPRDLEQTARTLGVLMRTLRELTSLLAEQQKLAPAAPAPDEDDDPVPKDIDEFRFELARRINAFIDEHPAQQADETGDP